MRIVHNDFRAPGACVICLGSTPGPDQGMIETGSRNDYGIVNERAGEIYVCINCAEVIAKLIGFTSKEAVAAELDEIRSFRHAHESVQEVLTGIVTLANTQLAAEPAAGGK